MTRQEIVTEALNWGYRSHTEEMYLYDNPNYIFQVNWQTLCITSFYGTKSRQYRFSNPVGVWRIRLKETESRPNHKLPSEL